MNPADRESQTSQVSNEVGKFHLSFGFDVLIVQISVEHDGGKCQQKHRVRSIKSPHSFTVALTVTISERL